MTTIQNEYLSLSIDDQARLIAFEHKKLGKGNVIARPVPLFRAVLLTKDNWENTVQAANTEMTIVSEAELVNFHIGALNSAMGRIEMEFILSIRLENERVWFDAKVINHSDSTLTDFYWPCIGAFKNLGNGRLQLIYSGGLGQLHTNIVEELKGEDVQGWDKMLSNTYPSNSAMQWMMLLDDTKCLYFTGKDCELVAGSMRVLGSKNGDVRMEMNKFAFVKPGETWKCPSYMLWFYEGMWQQAADEYREWTSSWRHPITPKKWIQNMTGFFLVINKQQYGDEIWSYHDIPKLYKLAMEHGCNTLGLFGWFDSGHDNFYPDLEVSETMGGEKVLREGIRKVHEMGGHIVLYFQGHLIDINTPYFQSGQGLKVACKDLYNLPYYEHYCKFSGSEFNRYFGGRTFAVACPWSKDWYKLLAQKAEWIYDLGADGVLFDQTGGIFPYPCFDLSHGHPRPSVSFSQGRLRLLSYIRETSINRHENFALMVEIVTDAYSQFIDCIHGGVETRKGDRLEMTKTIKPMVVTMPEVFRHIFPTTRITHRVARPYMEPRYVNGALCYGVPLEMEVRYLKDRQFIETNQKPEWKEYVRKVTAIRLKYADLLINGIYSSNSQIEKTNPSLKHGLFTTEKGDHCCIVLWNDNDEDIALRLDNKGFVRWETVDQQGEGIPTSILSNSFVILFSH